MSQKYLDLAGLNAYDGKIKEWFKAGVVDIIDDAIRALFVVPDNPYVTFTAEEDNSSIGLAKLSYNQTLEYSTDASTWETINITGYSLPLNKGDKLYVRGVLNGNNSSTSYTRFTMSGKISASGNCNAIWNYQDLNAPLKIGCGQYMFNGCTSLVKAPELPATMLAEGCYQQMFRGCTSLVKAPELPATNLARDCYYGMFSGCTSLTTTPELPATELAYGCYDSMFQNCTSLVQAPKLPATTLTEACYMFMFKGCTKLNYITCLATNISATYCTNSWVYGVSSTGTFVKHPSMSDWTTGISGIPEGWTVVDAEL